MNAPLPWSEATSAQMGTLEMAALTFSTPLS